MQSELDAQNAHADGVIMAAYVAGSNVQAETIQTLHLMNPGLSTCAEAFPVSANDNCNNNQNQHFLGYSVPSALQAMYMPQQGPSIPLPSRTNPYIWTNSTTTNEVPFVSAGEPTSLSHMFASRYASAVTPESQYSHLHIGSQHEGDALGSSEAHALSLSLSPGRSLAQLPYYDNIQSETLAAIPDLTYVVGDKRGAREAHVSYSTHFKNPSNNESVGANLHNYMSDVSARQTQIHLQAESSPAGGFFAHSKYLKAAQQLLNEVVNVEDAIKKGCTQAKLAKMGIHHLAGDMATEAGTAGREGMAWGLSIAKTAFYPEISSVAIELTPQAKQELQLKKAKLMAMLEEVDRRYKLYRSHMQGIASIFESAAGAGGARCYTALALQTISRHFRCLRDAISGQVRAAGKGLGEEDQLSQQRALQHLHMMHQHAWRPQRGLPERAVSVLRAWLFEHFLHPYPKDADKVLLAKQTGLTRNQVSNWFINARVRLWKPMVEEMYQEESREDDMLRSNDTEKQKDELRVISATRSEAPRRGIDTKLLRNASTEGSMDKDSMNEIQLHHFATAAFAQNTVPEASFIGTNSQFPLHEWQAVKKARNTKESFSGRGDMYPSIQTDEEKGPFDIAVRGIDPQSYNRCFSSAEASRGNVGGATVSLTLGLQHRDPIEVQSQAQQQQQHLFFRRTQEPNFVHSHGTMLEHVSQDLPDELLEKISVSNVVTAQNYLPSMTSTSFELLNQVQNQRQHHGHGLPADFAS